MENNSIILTYMHNVRNECYAYGYGTFFCGASYSGRWKDVQKLEIFQSVIVWPINDPTISSSSTSGLEHLNRCLLYQGPVVQS